MGFLRVMVGICGGLMMFYLIQSGLVGGSFLPQINIIQAANNSIGVIESTTNKDIQYSWYTLHSCKLIYQSLLWSTLHIFFKK